MPSRSNSTKQPPPGPPRRHESHRRDFQPQPPPPGPSRMPSRKASHKRPSAPQRSDTAHSHYINMLLSQDSIPKLHTILAAVFVWLLLAGFLVFPGTFTSIKESIDDAAEDTATTRAAATVLNTVKNIPLLVIGAVACGISAMGMLWLLIKHRMNYVWLLNRLLVPGVANSMAGMISTLIGVYTQQDGNWSITARVTAIIEGCYLLICVGLFVYYTVKLSMVKKRHDGFYEKGEGRRSEEAREQKKEEAAALEPGGSII